MRDVPGGEFGAEGGPVMTSLKCHRCGHFWTIGTLFPDSFMAINRFCPDCIPFSLPRMGVTPLVRRSC